MLYQGERAGRQRASSRALVTTLTLDGHGYMASIANPNAETYQSYLDSNGLLLGASISVTALGAIGLYLFRPRIQHGTGVQWVPAPSSSSSSRAPGADLR